MDSSKGDAYSYMREGQKEEDFGYQPNSDAGREGCYADNFWTPEFVPIRAKYNDYGSVEDLDIKSLNWSVWMDTINKRIVEVKQGSNEYHDPSVSKNMKLEQLLDVLREGRLIFDYRYRNYRVPVAQTMIREDVYQSMLSLKVKDQWWSKDREYNPASIYKDGISFFSNDKVKEAKKRLETSSNKETIERMRKYYKEQGEDFDEESYKEIPMHLFEDYSSNRDSHFNFRTGEGAGEGLSAYGKWVVRQLVEEKFTASSKQYKKLIQDISDFIFIRTLYSYLRKTWHPGTGCGSQSSEFALSADYYTNLAKLAKNVDEARKKEYGSEDE